MRRFLFSAGFFLVTVLLEISFFSSLPWFFVLTPFVFCLSVYLIQHEGMIDGCLWMIIYGILLDVFRITTIPFVTLSWMLAALATLFMARHVFSNRSFYGVLGCAFGGYLCLMISQSAILFFTSLTKKIVVDWSVFFQTILEQSFMLFLTMAFVFFLARRLRTSPFFL